MSKNPEKMEEAKQILAKTCSCGHDRFHRKTDTERKYSAWGWFLLVGFGISTPPKTAVVKCLVCNEVIIDAKKGQREVLEQLTY